MEKSNSVNVIDLSDNTKETEEAMHEVNPDAKLTSRELDQLIEYVSSGMSLEEIYKKLEKKYAEKPAEKKRRTRKPKEENRQKEIDNEIKEQVVRILQPVIHPPYTISVGIRYSLDAKRVVEIATTEPLGDRDIISAQEEVYIKLLESLNNILTKTQ
jgi:hypothetical protein